MPLTRSQCLLGLALSFGCGDDTSVSNGGTSSTGTTSSAQDDGADTSSDSGVTDGSVGETTDSGSTTGSGPTTTDGPGGCLDDSDCTDGLDLFCDTDSGMCTDCTGAMQGGDAACASLGAGTDVCDAGSGECAECTVDNSSACIGTSPVCDTVANACTGCSEHSECPGTACHLDGDDVGGCFEQADVQMIASAGALSTALSTLGPDQQSVFILTGSDYPGVTEEVSNNAEIAFIASGDATVSGNSGFAVLGVSGNAIAYFQNVTIGPNGIGAGIDCSATSVWLDDSEVSGNQVGIDVSGGCAAHLRRSTVTSNGAGGIAASGGELALVNSAVALNGNSVSPFGGLSLDSVTLFVASSTIAGNDSQNAAISLRCLGASTGDVRNSIVAGENANSIGTCMGIAFQNNGADELLGASNVNIGAFNAGWFVNPGANDYHLSAAGEVTFMDIAQWQAGDPLTDVDGDPIPTDMPSFPGYDQP